MSSYKKIEFLVLPRNILKDIETPLPNVYLLSGFCQLMTSRLNSDIDKYVVELACVFFFKINLYL